jgi:glycosyltransferase involved in cell wall biosynthesis
MVGQLQNTLFSLSSAYQRNISSEDYEVIVVENSSDDNMGAEFVRQLQGNFHYYLRDEPAKTPVHAVNFALEKCRGTMVGLIVDGARMLTPRVLDYALLAHNYSSRSLVAVPGYHLGTDDQKENMRTGHDQTTEKRLLEEIQWQRDGYRLFDIACFSSGNKRGYFQPLMECSALFCNTELLRSVGGADSRFTQLGGGSINLHIYRRLGLLPNCRIFILPGEGSFHQYHGGVTTSEAVVEREQMLQEFREFIDSVWGERFQALRREAIQLGAVTYPAQNFLLASAENAVTRFDRLKANKADFWPDDRLIPGYCTEQGS